MKFKIILSFLTLLLSQCLLVSSINIPLSSKAKKTQLYSAVLQVKPHMYSMIVRVQHNGNIIESLRGINYALEYDDTPAIAKQKKSTASFVVYPNNVSGFEYDLQVAWGDKIEITASLLGGNINDPNTITCGLMALLRMKDENGREIQIPTNDKWKCSSSNSMLEEKCNVYSFNTFVDYFTSEKIRVNAIFNQHFDQFFTTFSLEILKENVPAKAYIYADDILTDFRINNNPIQAPNLGYFWINELKVGDEIKICYQNGKNVANVQNNRTGVQATFHKLGKDGNMEAHNTNFSWTCNGQKPYSFGSYGLANFYGPKRYNKFLFLEDDAMTLTLPNLSAACCSYKIPASPSSNSTLRYQGPALKKVSVNGINQPISSLNFDNMTLTEINAKLGDTVELQIQNVNNGAFSGIITIGGSSEMELNFPIRSSTWICGGNPAVVKKTLPNFKNTINHYDVGSEEIWSSSTTGSATDLVCSTVLTKPMAEGIFYVDDFTTSLTINNKPIQYFGSSSGWNVPKYFYTEFSEGDTIEVCGKNGGTQNNINNPAMIILTLKYFNSNGELEILNTNQDWKCGGAAPFSWGSNEDFSYYVGKRRYLKTDVYLTDVESEFIWDQKLLQNACCTYTLPSYGGYDKNLISGKPKDNILVAAENLKAITVNGKEIPTKFEDFSSPKKIMVNLKIGDNVAFIVNAKEVVNPAIRAVVTYGGKTAVTDNTWKCNGQPADLVAKFTKNCRSFAPGSQWIWVKEKPETTAVENAESVIAHENPLKAKEIDFIVTCSFTLK